MPPSPDRSRLPPVEAYKGPEPFVFVSYSHADHADVFAELRWLHQAGCRLWYDEGIEGGSAWSEEIAGTLDRCTCFLVFVSPSSVASEHVCNEIRYALDHKKPIVPVYLASANLPKGLELRMGGIQAIHKYQTPRARYRKQLEKSLAAAIVELAPPPAVEKAEPQRPATPIPQPPVVTVDVVEPLSLPRFHYGSVVPPDYYIDREKELAEALAIVEAEQSFLLVGDRRSGKTSFCKKLIHALMGRPGNTVLASYLNLQRCHDLHIQSFLQETITDMIGEIARQVFRCKYTDLLRSQPAEALPHLKADPHFEAFLNIFHQVRRQTQADADGTARYLTDNDFIHVVRELLELIRQKNWTTFAVFYDEANRLPGAVAVEQLMSRREALEESGVVSVYAASPDLAESFAHLKGWFNDQVFLGSFPSPADMKKLLSRYYFGESGRTTDLPVTPAAQDLLWTLTRGLPYLIQLLAGQSFRCAMDSGSRVVDAPHVEAARKLVEQKWPEVRLGAASR